MHRSFVHRRGHRGFPWMGAENKASCAPAQELAEGVSSHAAFQHDLNAKVYRRGWVVHRYQHDTQLTRAEVMVLLKHQPEFGGKDVLDIGVGTGRTTAYLVPLSRRYQAIDYSPEMVARFQRNFPGVPVALADMADLSAFGDASFDFVLATNNVFDAVGHADRLQTLHEIRRVLRPRGSLVFSSHNRNVQNLGRTPPLELSYSPVTQLLHTARWGVTLINHARLAGRQRFTDEYAIVNDEAHAGASLHYYIGPAEQRRQLAEAGFELVDMFDRWGKPLALGDPAPHSRWLFYVAKRVQIS